VQESPYFKGFLQPSFKLSKLSEWLGGDAMLIASVSGKFPANRENYDFWISAFDFNTTSCSAAATFCTIPYAN
jgi:hypothetical protein